MKLSSRDAESYVTGLDNERRFWCIDRSTTKTYVLSDVCHDGKNVGIKTTRFKHIYPFNVATGSTSTSFFICECKEASLRHFTESLGAVTASVDLKKTIADGQCVHTEALRMLESIRSSPKIIASNSNIAKIEAKVDGNGRLSFIHLSVTTNPVYDSAIVGAGGRKGAYGSFFKCFTCNVPYACKHVYAVANFMDDTEDADLATLWGGTFDHLGFRFKREKNTGGVLLVNQVDARPSVSTTKIPFCKPVKGVKDRIKVCIDSMTTAPFREPFDSPCPTCGSNVIERVAGGTLYGMYGSKSIDVVNHYCSSASCPFARKFDGSELGIFNFSGASLFTHEFMDEAVTLLKASIPITSILMISETRYENLGTKMCSYNTFRDALYAYIELLDIDYAGGMRCEICSRVPAKDRVVIADGKVMGHLSQYVTPTNPVVAADAPPLLNGRDLYYIGDAAVRKYINGMTGGVETKTLRNKIQHIRAYGYANLADALGVFPGNEKKIPKPFWRFFMDISSVYPTVTLVSRNDAHVLEPILSKKAWSHDDIASIGSRFPSLLEGILGMKWTSLDDKFLALVKDIFAVSENMHRHGVRDAPFMGTADGLDSDPLTFVNNQGAPEKAFKKIRTYPTFAEDAARGKRKRDSETCNKYHHVNRNLTQGIFTLLCPHGICIGVMAMRNFEGPTTLLKILYEYFEVMPGVIVYDNCCNFASTVFRRFPTLFANTRFLIDREHQRNHVGCHSSFNMKMWPATTTVLGGGLLLKDTNSQVAEQLNSRLDTLSTQLAYMNERHYKETIMLFVHQQNRTKKKTAAFMQSLSSM